MQGQNNPIYKIKPKRRKPSVIASGIKKEQIHILFQTAIKDLGQNQAGNRWIKEALSY